MTDSRQKIVVIAGPTASGKSELAVRLAERFDGEVVNADSMQIYRGMDIGTAKPAPELRRRVPHHLLDIVTPDVNFTAAAYVARARSVVAEITARGRLPVVAGGTGLYIRALLGGLALSPGGDEALRLELAGLADREGNSLLHERLRRVDPVTADRLHPNDRLRIIRALEVYQQSGRPLSSYQRGHGFSDEWCRALQLGIQVEREELYQRVDARVDQMIANGLIDEVRGLLAAGYSPALKSMSSIGYREVCGYLTGSCPLPETVELIKRNTRRYAKRQLTWFKREAEIYWVEYPETFATICNHVIEFLSQGAAHDQSTI